MKNPLFFKPIFVVKFPIVAYFSIMHRLSGVMLLFCIPLCLWVFEFSLKSSKEFESIQHFMANPLILLTIFFIFTAFVYHLVMGIRHMLLDIGIGESMKWAKIGGFVAFLLIIIICAMFGVYLWQKV